MAGINEYDTTAGSNSNISGIDISEGCAPSGINNAIRQIMADSRSQWNDANWFQYGDGSASVSITYAGATSFTVDNVDVSSIYHVGRRLKAVGSTTGTIYGTITAVAYVSDTTVTVSWDSGSLNNESLTIYLSILESTSDGIPNINRDFSLSADLTVDTDTLHVDSTNNRVGIKTTTPSTTLDVVGDTTITGDTTINSATFLVNNSGGGEKQIEAIANSGVNLYHNNSLKLQTTSPGVYIQNGGLGVGVDASTTDGVIRATGNVIAYYSSDASLKENVKNIENPMDKVSQINGVTFDWTEDYLNKEGGEDGYFVRKNDIGVIAQEIEKVLPQIVAERKDGTKAVKYDRLCALLIECVKDLQSQINDLKKGA